MNYLILGANAAGMSAAVRIKKLDKQANVIVLEKTDVVSFGSCGIPYFIAGEFDDINQLTARSLDEFTQSGIDIRQFHTVMEINPDSKKVTAKVTAQDGKMQQIRVFDYDKLLIAVGASPVIPPIKGIHAKNCYTMHSRNDAIAIANALPHCKNVVIIGAGFIGVEAAEAFSEQGKQVTVIESLERVLARTYDPEMTQHLEVALQRHGVGVQLNERVLEIKSEQGAVTSVLTDKGDYPADLVIVATGFKPNTGFLQNSLINLSIEGAIHIDDQCKTNLPDIFAAGDCATVPHKLNGDVYIPLATSANKLGRIAGEVMAGKYTSRFIGALGSSGIRVFDMEAGRTGMTEAEAKQLKIDYATVVVKDKNHADSVAGQTDIWVKLIYNQTTRVLLGGQVVGSYSGGAVQRTNALAVAIYSNLTVEELGYMDFIYAPPFARTWDSLNVAGNVAKGRGG